MRVAGLRTGASGHHRRDEHAVHGNGISRRTFMGWLIAAPTLIAAAEITTGSAKASIPTVQPVDHYDLSDLLTDAALPTSNLITVEVNPDGTVSFALPRAEVGQGITTAVAMTIADEMDIALDKVTVTLADARPELLFNQLTGGSNTMHAIYTPVRVAAALARQRMTDAAAQHLGGTASGYSVHNGIITAPDGRSITFGELTRRAAVKRHHPHAGGAQAGLPAAHRRHPAAPDRRPRHRHRRQAVRDGPRRPGRAADDGLPAADDQRQRQQRPEPDGGEGDAGGHRRGDHPPYRAGPGRGGGASPDLRPVHRRRPRAQGDLGAGFDRGQVGGEHPRRPEGRRAAADTGGAAGQVPGAAVHVPLPAR